MAETDLMFSGNPSTGKLRKITQANVVASIGASEAEAIAGTSTTKVLTPAVGAAAQPSVDVRWFGAVGDGTTDNTSSIQSAFDFVVSSGRPVRIPEGTFVVSKQAGEDFMLAATPGLRIVGPGTLKVSNSAGNYRTLLGAATPTTDLSDLVVDGVTFDMNSAGNPVADTATLLAGFPRYAVYAAAGERIAVRNCTFKDIDSINAVALNGGLGAATPPAVVSASITGNAFHNVGGADLHDHSTIYTHAEGVTVAGNQFYGASALAASAVSAIETHGSGTRIVGNHIERYRQGINATGIAHRTEGMVVAGNTLRDVLSGIKVFSQVLSGGGAIMLRGTVVTGNTVLCDVDAWAALYDEPPSGISVVQTAGAYFHGLAIVGNTVEIKTYTGTSTNIAQILAGGIVVNHSGSPGTVSTGLIIADNVIRGAVSSSIVLTGVKISGARITGNVCNDWGHASIVASSDYKAGVSVAGELANAAIAGNTLVDSSALGLRGISWIASSGSTGSSIEDNRVNLAATTGAGARDLTIIASSGAPYVRHRYRTGTSTPTGACEYDSEIAFIAGGTKVRQTTAGSGTTWA